MKTIPIITFFLCTVMYAHAQLNIVPKNDGLKEYTVTNAHPYDSLTNVEKRSFTSLPGQTLYMHGVKNDRNGYWDAFYTVNFLTGDDRTVYKAVNISTTPSKEIVGKYYEVVKVWTKIDYLSIIRKSKFPQNPKRSVRFSGKRTKRSVQKRKARNTQKAETKVL